MMKSHIRYITDVQTVMSITKQTVMSITKHVQLNEHIIVYVSLRCAKMTHIPIKRVGLTQL